MQFITSLGEKIVMKGQQPLLNFFTTSSRGLHDPQTYQDLETDMKLASSGYKT
jgi:hypothetical protein